MFDGLKLNSGRIGSQSQQERASPSLDVSRQEPEQEDVRKRSEMKRGVDGYARAYGSIQRQEKEKLPVLDSQKQALQDAGDKLDRIEPGSSELLSSALKHDPHTARAMTERSGGERTSALIEGMEREKLQQQDPNVRASRFVKEWQGLSERRQDNDGWRPSEIAARKEAEGLMRDMVQKLEKDPAMESALRQHGRDLGIGFHLREGQNVSQELEKNIQRGPSQGLGM